MTVHPLEVKQEIKARAASLGFSVCGITSPDPLEHHHEYVDWLQHNYHAGMRYLASPYHVTMRQSPEKVYPGLQSIIVLGLPYPLHHQAPIEGEPVGLISGYVHDEDYHTRIPRMIRLLLQFIATLDPDASAPRVFTDSAPILERELAVRAGLGWIGRNACLISPQYGSNLLLAEIFTALRLEPDPPYTHEHCGNCNRCMEACPTGCILPDRKIDANFCISYHNIENRGEIPPAVIEKLGSWIFGCDTCQVVCPWNHHTLKFSDLQGQANQLTLEEMLQILETSPLEFEQQFGKSAVARTGYVGFLRNIFIRLGLLREARAISKLQEFALSTGQPVLQQTAAWAIKQLQLD